MTPRPDRPRLLHVFPTFAIGGAQTRFCDIANHFSTTFSHLVLALDGNTEACRRLNSEVPVTLVPYSGIKGSGPRSLFGIVRMLAQLRPDLLLTYNWGAMDWVIANTLACACPLIHTEDGFNEDEAGGQKRRRVWTRRLFLSKACSVIVPSRVLQTVAETMWKVPSSKVKYIANGVDLSVASRFMRPAVSDNEYVTIGTVASIRKVKNIGRLVRLFQELPSELKVRLSIVGNGPDLDSVKCQAGNDQRITFHGYQALTFRFIDEMDIFALTSDSEQMPIAVVEAMAMGKPVLSTDVGDIKEMVSEANRDYVVPVAREDRFLECMISLIHEPETRKVLGEANRERCIANFDRTGMLTEYGALYMAATAGAWGDDGNLF